MFSKVYGILSSVLGESKMGGYDRSVEQYQFDCPHCAEENGGEPDGKKHLEVNFRIGKCHCWKCEYKGTLSKLLRRYGGEDTARDYIDEVKSVVQSGLYRLDYLSELTETIEIDNIKLPDTFKKIGDISKLRNKRLKEYLEKRKITQEMVDRFQLGYTGWDGETQLNRSRLIIPSYDRNGYLNYWTGRDFTGYDNRMRYVNVKYDRKKIVFNESLIEWDGDIVLVEGIIDSIVTPNCIPLMGKQLYKDSEIYNKLMEKANAEIIICLDGDTTIDETKRIYRLLNKGRLQNHISYVRMDKYKDMGDAYVSEGKEGVVNILRTARKFTEFDLIF